MRKARFAEGGLNPYQGDDVDPFSAVRGADGGTTPMAEGPDSEELRDETGAVSKTRRNLETGELYSTEAPKAAPRAPARPIPKATPKAVPTSAARNENYSNEGRNRSAPRAEIPGQEVKAPAASGKSTSGMSNFDKLTAGIPAGMGATRFLQAGARGLANVMRGREAAKQTAQANAKQIGEGRKMLESPGTMKQRGLDEARAGRAAKRDAEMARENARAARTGQRNAEMASENEAAAATGRARMNAEALERAKPVMQARKDTKSSRAARTRRTEEDAGVEFAKGGAVKGWGKARGAKGFKVY